MKKNIYVSYLAQIVLAATNFLFSLIFLGILGPTIFGHYSIFFNSILFFVLFFGLNLSSVLPFFIVNRKIDPERFLFTAFLYIASVTVFIFFMLQYSGELGFSRHIFPGGENKSIWIWFFTIYFFLIQCNQLITSYLNAHRIFIKVSVVNLVVNLLMLFFWLAVALGLVSPLKELFDLIWIVFIVGNTFILFWLVIIALKAKHGTGRLGILEISEAKEVIRFTFIVYVCNALQFLVYRMDLFFINAYHPGPSVGTYSLSLTLSQLIWILPSSVSTIIISYLNMKEREESVKLGVKYGAVSLYGSIAVSALFTAFLYFFLPWIYGDAASEIFRLSLIMFIGTIPFSVSIIIANMNSGIGFVRLNLYSTVLIFIVTAILDAILIPPFGIYGAAAVKIAVYVAGLAVQISFGIRNYGLPWRRLFVLPRWRDL